jgi:hypothetical protein
MAKTDDPVYDLQTKVQKLNEDVQVLTTRCKNVQDDFMSFAQAVNDFLRITYPTNREIQFGVVDWNLQRENRQREEWQRQRAIAQLVGQGYTITPPTESTGPK